MWSGLPSSRQQSVEAMFKACSFGMAEVSKRVGGSMLRVAVPVPCSGVTPQGQSYNSQSCPFNGELKEKGTGVRAWRQGVWIRACTLPVPHASMQARQLVHVPAHA